MRSRDRHQARAHALIAKTLASPAMLSDRVKGSPGSGHCRPAGRRQVSPERSATQEGIGAGEHRLGAARSQFPGKTLPGAGPGCRAVGRAQAVRGHLLTACVRGVASISAMCCTTSSSCIHIPMVEAAGSDRLLANTTWGRTNVE